MTLPNYVMTVGDALALLRAGWMLCAEPGRLYVTDGRLYRIVAPRLLPELVPHPEILYDYNCTPGRMTWHHRDGSALATHTGDTTSPAAAAGRRAA